MEMETPNYAIIGYRNAENSFKYVSSVYQNYCNFTDIRQDALHVPCTIAENVAYWFIDKQQRGNRDGYNKQWFVETVKTEIDQQPVMPF